MSQTFFGKNMRSKQSARSRFSDAVGADGHVRVNPGTPRLRVAAPDPQSRGGLNILEGKS
jgi:hypothetical protein